MKAIFTLLSFLACLTFGFGQTQTSYQVSFEKAIHHEATIVAHFIDIPERPLEVRMSRTSPGRYAIHEFAKNVYGVSATDSKGNALEIARPDPYSWMISGHDGEVHVTYTVFGDRGDGTYSQIDDTHAHLNIPATFMYAPSLAHRPIQVSYDLTTQPKWKVATQMKDLGNNTFWAPELHYFMDSPMELSDFYLAEWKVSENHPATFRFVLHHEGTDAEAAAYVESVKKIVIAEQQVFDEFPTYDFGVYTFLACYMPNASGDGMEHRNSTIITSTRSLANGGMKGNLGTVSHEFFHSWNVERIRPRSLQPFNYEEANMSGELWFAEGFTSYYTSLFLKRAGLISSEEYVEGLKWGLNFVENSPARKYFNPIEMSYQAPFVDAATSVDPVNRENMFISYYTYGSVLGLALDLELRNMKEGLSLDDFMKKVWQLYGKTEQSYSVKELQAALEQYAGQEFGNKFFTDYIYSSKMPDYQKLLASVGVDYSRENSNEPWTGTYLNTRSGVIEVVSNPLENSPAYQAGWMKGDVLLKINGKDIKEGTDSNALFEKEKPGNKVKVTVKRFGRTVDTILVLGSNPDKKTQLVETSGKKISKEMEDRRNAWLNN